MDRLLPLLLLMGAEPEGTSVVATQSGSGTLRADGTLQLDVVAQLDDMSDLAKSRALLVVQVTKPRSETYDFAPFEVMLLDAEGQPDDDARELNNDSVSDISRGVTVDLACTERCTIEKSVVIQSLMAFPIDVEWTVEVQAHGEGRGCGTGTSATVALEVVPVDLTE
jgi:hypothetical protein